ncbi:MAG: cell division protein ZapB [Candidatus Krumholzibacteria bacterium]|jgi:predicted nuclease with TOPRIM domain|nr:cell division protein ZapB [Candidatus Krumholzibacteria bacterium]
MDDQLARLESKVLAAISLLKELRLENSQLTERCATLDERCRGLQDQNEQFAKDLQLAQQNAAVAGDFEQKRQLIERKVAGLLDKLEAIG